jgi:hypothetical protein
MIKKTRAFLRKYSEDLLFLAGCLAILIGSHQINPLAAWFVGGAECLIAGFLLAWSKRK